MNIYITANTPRGSAKNLDSLQLKKQLNYLMQIFSNVLHCNEDYDFLLRECFRGEWGVVSYKDRLFPPLLVEHSTTQWAMQSPVHTLFIAEYLMQCYYTLRDRGYLYRTIPHVHTAASFFKRKLHDILPLNGVSPLYNLDENLYRNTPTYLSNEKNVIKAYQFYLTKKWKGSILRQFQYEDANTKYLMACAGATYPAKDVGGKPRKASPLKWGGSNLQYIPAFAAIELNAYIKELNDAKNNRGTTNSS